MRDAESEKAAETAAMFLRTKIGGVVPPIGLVLGTGWGDAVPWERVTSIPFGDIPGFGRLRPLEGHARKALFGTVDGHAVLALQGRVHLNEAPSDPELARMVRLQVEMLLKLGVRKLILTAAAGSLRPGIDVGDVMVVDGFVTLFAPDMPLYAGEFCSPEDTLDQEMRDIALEVTGRVIRRERQGAYAMVRGPFFEGRKLDKGILGAMGASSVGMSTLPEACIAALYPGTKVLALNFITNSATEDHSHETNQARAKDSAARLGECLKDIIHRL